MKSDHSSGLDVLASLPSGRKASILAVLCFALFLDTFNNSSLFAGIPPIAEQLNIPNTETPWLLAAYQLTFAALLLISGRISDLYNPKYVFLTGVSSMAVFALVAGFMRHEVPLIVFRALMGAGGALTIPSAMHLIVHIYPDPVQQAKAVTIFGGMGAIGLVIGLVIGAAIVSLASWPWIFYVSTIVSCVIATLVFLLVPNTPRGDDEDKTSKIKRLDMAGVSILTAALILFIFAITSGSIQGWKSAVVLAPLIISVFLGIAFFMYERLLPESYASVPPKMWRYENFTVLIIIALEPFMWWGSIFPVFSFLWETVYGWSALDVALHFLPIALGLFPALPLAGLLQSKLRLKWVLLIGQILLIAGTVLLPFANSKAHYWRYTFPGFLLGTSGAAILYATSNIATLAVTPASVSGIVSAIFMAALQTGGAAGVAIITSIQTSVQETHGGPTAFSGRAAGMWFLVAFFGLMTVVLIIFMKDTVGPVDPSAPPPRKPEEGDLEEKIEKLEGRSSGSASDV